MLKINFVELIHTFTIMDGYLTFIKVTCSGKLQKAILS
jgi:hypothetical protein